MVAWRSPLVKARKRRRALLRGQRLKADCAAVGRRRRRPFDFSPVTTMVARPALGTIVRPAHKAAVRTGGRARVSGAAWGGTGR